MRGIIAALTMFATSAAMADTVSLSGLEILADPQQEPFVDIQAGPSTLVVPYAAGQWHQINVATLGFPADTAAIKIRGRLQFSRTDTYNLVATYVNFCTQAVTAQCVNNWTDSRNARWKALVPHEVNGGRFDFFDVIPTPGGVLTWRWDTDKWSVATRQTKYGSVLLWADGFYRQGVTQ